MQIVRTNWRVPENHSHAFKTTLIIEGEVLSVQTMMRDSEFHHMNSGKLINAMWKDQRRSIMNALERKLFDENNHV